jgi:hypothetical protein
MILKMVLCYYNFSILDQSHLAHMFQANTTDHTITYKAQYWKNHTLLSVLHNQYDLIYFMIVYLIQYFLVMCSNN